MLERFRPWEVLTEGEDWERIGDVIYFLRWWGIWPSEDEIKVDYLGGYGLAPEDIRDALLELASNQYVTDSTVASNASSGTSGITSEKIGDFSYSVGTSTTVSSSSTIAGADGSALGSTMMTLQRYKRRFQ